MKKNFLIFLVVVFALTFCGCGDKNNEVNHDHSHGHNHSDENGQALNPDEIIKVYLDVRLYENLLGEKFEFKLRDKDKENGFLTIEKHNDFTALYTIKRKDFNVFKEGLLLSRKSIFDDYYKNNDANSIKKVEYNSNITEITVTVDRKVYNPKIFSRDKAYVRAYNTISGCGRNATLYHMYYLENVEKCTVTVMDLSGNLLETRVFPDEILEDIK